jgi:hypothetical protein
MGLFYFKNICTFEANINHLKQRPMSKLFAHEKLIQDNQINVSELDADTQGFIKEFKSTMQGVKMIAAKTGKVDIKPDTEAKLRRLDKVICDGIFDFLDEDENNPPAPPTPPQPPINEPTPPINNPAPPINQNNPPAPPTPPQDPPKKKGFMMGIGFYDED